MFSPYVSVLALQRNSPGALKSPAGTLGVEESDIAAAGD